MSIQELINQLNEGIEKRERSFSELMKQILLMSSSLLGILVSFHKLDVEAYCSNIAFSVAILLLLLGVLAGSIRLHAAVHVYKRLLLDVKEELLEQLSQGERKVVPVSRDLPKFYKVCESVCYFSLIAAVMCLGVYAILMTWGY